MEEKINKINTLLNVDISKYTTEAKYKYYKSIIKNIDMEMDKKDIEIDLYEKLLQLKKNAMSKLMTLEENN